MQICKKKCRRKKSEKALQARAKMILSEGEEEASRRLVDAGNFFGNDDHAIDAWQCQFDSDFIDDEGGDDRGEDEDCDWLAN